MPPYKQLKKIPRSSIAAKSLKNNGILMYVKSDKKILEIINKVGPEHCELNVKVREILSAFLCKAPGTPNLSENNLTL